MTLRSYIFKLLFYAWTLLLLLVLTPTIPFVSAARVRRYAAFWERGIHWLLARTLGIRYRIEGRDRLPDEPVIIASKHQSAWETLIFHMLEPDLVIGLKKELTMIPLFGWFLVRGGMIVIDRRGAAKALRSLTDGAREAIKSGCSLLIFPEGTRHSVDAPADYKSGVAGIYTALGVPVVPVALNSGLFWGSGTNKRSGTVTLAFLEPIPPGLARKDFMARLENAIETRTRELIATGSQPDATAGGSAHAGA